MLTILCISISVVCNSLELNDKVKCNKIYKHSRVRFFEDNVNYKNYYYYIKIFV